MDSKPQLLLPATIDPRSRESIDERINQQKEKLIEVFKTIPFISVAVKKVEIDKSTYYRWIEQDKEFLKKVKIAKKEGFSHLHDRAFSVLTKYGTDGTNWHASLELIKYIDRLQDDQAANMTNDLSVIFSNPKALIALADILKLADSKPEEKKEEHGQ